MKWWPQKLAWYWHALIGGVVILIILCLPVPVTVADTPNSHDSKQTIHLSQQEPLEQTLYLPLRGIVELIVRLPEQPLPSPDTKFEVTISDASTARILHQATTTFGDAHRPATRTLSFPFPALAEQTIRVRLAAPDILPEEPLTLEAEEGTYRGKRASHQLRAALPLGAALTHLYTTHSTEGEDVFYTWNEGRKLERGRNPYICVLDDTCLQHKNPIYFPLFYWLSATAQHLGLEEYPVWFAFWQKVFILAWFAIGIMIYTTHAHKNLPIFGIVGALLWLFNRWSLYALFVGHIDFLSLFFLVLSIVLLVRYRRLATVLFGISLALKQVGIFLFPLYLIAAWRGPAVGRWWRVVAACGEALLVPLVVSLPFLFDHPRAFFAAIGFSAGRSNQATLLAPSLGPLLNMPGVYSTVIVLVLMTFVYLGMWHQKLRPATTAILIFTVFIAFNTVLFNQYFVWLIPFIPLAIAESD